MSGSTRSFICPSWFHSVDKSSTDSVDCIIACCMRLCKEVVMKSLATLAPLTTQLVEIQHISSAASLLSWDQETYMPNGGGHARAEQIATLQTLAHDRFVSPDIERVLSRWIDPST